MVRCIIKSACVLFVCVFAKLSSTENPFYGKICVANRGSEVKRKKVMWEKKVYKKNIKVQKQALWKALTDVSTWKSWNPGVEKIFLHGAFTQGSAYEIKMSKTPAVKMKITEVDHENYFIDRLSLPGAKLDRKVELIEHNGQIDICVTLSLSGMSANMWKNVVGDKLLKKVPEMLDNLERYVQEHPELVKQ